MHNLDEIIDLVVEQSFFGKLAADSKKKRSSSRNRNRRNNGDQCTNQQCRDAGAAITLALVTVACIAAIGGMGAWYGERYRNSQAKVLDPFILLSFCAVGGYLGYLAADSVLEDSRYSTIQKDCYAGSAFVAIETCAMILAFAVMKGIDNLPSVEQIMEYCQSSSQEHAQVETTDPNQHQAFEIVGVYDTHTV